MAAVNYFLKLDGIDGESTDRFHANQIEVLSWSWGESNAGNVAHGGGGIGARGHRVDEEVRARQRLRAHRRSGDLPRVRLVGAEVERQRHARSLAQAAAGRQSLTEFAVPSAPMLTTSRRQSVRPRLAPSCATPTASTSAWPLVNVFVTPVA